MNVPRTYPASEGFTVVEMVVSIFVASVFLLSLITIFTTFNYFTAGARQESVADNLTYNYLQKYTSPDNPSSGWFTCDTTDGAANTNDRTINPNADGGAPIEGGSLNADSVNLPTPVTYSVKAYAPYGCAVVADGQSIIVIASVTYGRNAKVITHAAYAAEL